MVLVIRADASPAIGTGHVMRCLAIAQAATKRGIHTVFHTYCPIRSIIERLHAEELSVIETEENCPPEDFARSFGLCKYTEPIWVLLDGYHFTENHHAALRATGARLIVIDDYNHLTLYACDILLNPSIGSNHFNYITTQDTVKLIGPSYAILREEFYNTPLTPRIFDKKERNILLTMGGADPYNTALTFIKILNKIYMPSTHLYILLGPANIFLQSITDAALNFSCKYSIIQSAQNMPQLLSNIDIAITAAGSTCLELAYMGIPMIAISLAENQNKIAQGIDTMGIGISLGYHTNLQPDYAQNCIEEFLNIPEQLAEMSQRAMTTINPQAPDIFFKTMGVS